MFFERKKKQKMCALMFYIKIYKPLKKVDRQMV